MLTTKIRLSKQNIVDGYVSIPLFSSFSPETQQYEQIENNFNLYNDDIINKTIDYEKVKLYPVSEETDAHALLFKLHFINNNSEWDTDSTKLSSIGFIDEDVEFKKEKLSKSFIRLSFYDSENISTQNLIYYSTIFLDPDVLYSKYILNGNSITGLTTEFICEDPKISSRIKSFEGFYLFLFKDDIIKTETKTIYMRVDFNNASNGRSVLFTKEKPNDNSGYTMEELKDNLFFEIECKYDRANNRYVYSFEGETITTIIPDVNDKKITKIIELDIYQAKVR